MRENGIEIQTTVGYAPEQNGIAERQNQTLVESVRAMINCSELPMTLWGEALFESAYNLNRVPGARGKAPYELFLGKIPDLSDLHEFGCKAYIPIPIEKRKKLDDKALEVRYVGHDSNAKGKRFWDPSSRKVVIATGEVFVDDSQHQAGSLKTQRCEIGDSGEDASSVHDQRLDKLSLLSDPIFEIFTINDHTNGDANANHDRQVEEGNNDNGDDNSFESQYDTAEESESEESEHEDERPPPRRSQRSNFGVPEERLNYSTFHVQIINESKSNDPKTLKQALSSRDNSKWLSAMQQEYDSLMKNGTWTLVDPPKDRNIVGCKWVFKTKTDCNNEISDYKARLVAQGFTQKYGEDYDEIFAPVVRPTTIRMLLNIAARKNLKVRQFDIKSAFLNGTLSEEIFMRQPKGFEIGDKVCRLNKALYGLKQSAHVWNQTIDKTLSAFGFKVSESDPCLYSKVNEIEESYLIIHVDDILAASNKAEHIDNIEKNISSFFELKNLGDVHNFLSINIEKDDAGDYFMSQQNYIEKIIEEGNLSAAKSSSIPLDTGYYKLKSNDFLPTNEQYRKLIGMLLYASTNTRPDIAASVSILSRKTAAPTKLDLNEVHRVIRYLSSTKNLKLRVSNKSSTSELELFSDSDFAEDRTDRKSISGQISFYGGGTLSWQSKKQDCVSISSTEAEYYALSTTAQEAIWLERLCQDFNVPLTSPIPVNADNQSAMVMIETDKFRNSTKHIETRYHFIKELNQKGIIKLSYVPGINNTADMLTKPLSAVKLKQLREQGGLVHLLNPKIEEGC